MTKVTIRATELKSVLREALRLAEGKILLHATKSSAVASPCREGWFVQRLRLASVEGSGTFAISPEIVSRCCDVLSALSGAVTIAFTGGELTLRAGNKMTCEFSGSAEEAHHLPVNEPFTECTLLVSGIPFKEALSRATLPSSVGPEGVRQCSLRAQARVHVIDLHGWNGFLESRVALRTDTESPVPAFYLPPELLSRSFACRALWSNVVKIRVGDSMFLGNSRSFLMWDPNGLETRTTNSPADRGGSSWSASAGFSCWVSDSAILSAVDALKRETKRQAPAHAFDWQSGGLRLSPVFRARIGNGWVRSNASAAIETSSETLEKPGSLIVSTEALHTLHVIFRATEQQLKLSDNSMVFGSPASFVTVLSA